MVNDRQLNSVEFSERFSRILFEHYPQWQNFQTSTDLSNETMYDLMVQVPSRFAPRCPLCIAVKDGQLFIAWAGWWEEWDSYADDYSEEEIFTAAVELISDILAERCVIVTAWSDRGVEAGCNYPIEELNKRMDTSWSILVGKEFETVAVSWSGTYDRGQFDPMKC